MKDDEFLLIGSGLAEEFHLRWFSDHLNLNDQTVEGLRHRVHPAFSVQYHPEAAPGPHDSAYLFEDFIHLMKSFKKGSTL